MSTDQRYPLSWPVGWKRTGPMSRRSAMFRENGSNGRRLEVGDGTARVIDELRRMGVATLDIIISSDLRVRSDGLPYASQNTRGIDPGVAVYWPAPGSKTAQRCIAADLYDRIADNMAAIAATLEALRAVERHGGATILNRAFMGFTALPAPEQWFSVLGVPANAFRSQVDAAWRALISAAHPDKPGASGDPARINTARDDAYRINGWR